MRFFYIDHKHKSMIECWYWSWCYYYSI